LAKEQNYPLVFASAYSQDAGNALNEASANGLVPTSRILRSALDLWRWHHRALVQQGFAPLNATDYLLKQTEGKHAPAQPPQPAPMQPMQSPFAPQPMNGKPHANP
jgi:hypothetical protein